MPKRNPPRHTDLSTWGNTRICIPRSESDIAFQDYFKGSSLHKRVLSLRQKLQQEPLNKLDKRRKIDSPVKSPLFFETNRRTVMPKETTPKRRLMPRKVTRSAANRSVTTSSTRDSPTLSSVSTDSVQIIADNNSSASQSTSSVSTKPSASSSSVPLRSRRAANLKKIINKPPLKSSKSAVANKNARAEEVVSINQLVRLSRRETFSASHRLHNPKLSNQQNAQIYDKCNNLHGHNYVVYVILQGPIDKQTGMVYNIGDLKQELGKVLDTLDHKNLDEDVDFFKTHVSTVENIASYIASTLKLSKPELLYKIKVCETEKNTASVYLGNE